MVSFIDAHREAYGVLSVCRVLPIAPSTYHAHVASRVEPTRRSARARRDDALRPEVRRVFEENFYIYGVRKNLPRRGPGSGGKCDVKGSTSLAALLPA